MIPRKNKIINGVEYFTCNKCLEFKTQDCFYSNSASPSLLSYTCKKCHLNIMKCNVKYRFRRIYYKIKKRCSKINETSYKNYGGRGIKCLWKSFEDFKNDMYVSYINYCENVGGREPYKISIDRIDNDGNYCKENCRRTNAKTQQNNKRVTLRFEGKTIYDISQETGLNQGLLIGRIRGQGKTVSNAIKMGEAKKFIKRDYKGKKSTQIAEENGIKYSTLLGRLNRGIDYDTAISVGKQMKRGLKYKYYYDNITLKEYATKNGLPYRTIMKKILGGFSVEEAITRCNEYKNHITLKDISNNLTISYGALRQKLRRGGDLQEIINKFKINTL